MKKINEDLKRKVLCGILAVAAISVTGNVWADEKFDNVVGTVTVGESTVDKVPTSGEISLGADDQSLVIDGGTDTYADAVALYNNNDHLTLKGKNITIQGNNEGYGICLKNIYDGGTDYSSATIGGDSTEKITVSSGDWGVMATRAHVKLQAGEINITSRYNAAVWVQNNTQDKTAPEDAASLDLIADKISIKNKVTDDTDYGIGVAAFSNGQLNITGDTTIEALNALDVRGNSTVNINTDGKHTTVIKGDVVFETPATPEDSKNSGNLINAYVNLNLTGEASKWEGKAYQQYGKQDGDTKYPTSVELNVQPYYGNVTGFKLTIADDAAWNMTGDSFVNEATLSNGGTINVSKDVKVFNADKITMTGGAFNALGGTTTINTLTSDKDSTISLSDAKLTAKEGTIALKELNISGTSSFTAPSAVTADTINVTGGAFAFSGGAVINNDLAVAKDASITLAGGTDALYTVGGTIAKNGGTVVLSGGTLKEDNLTNKLEGKLEIKDTGILSTKSSQIYKNAASEIEKDAGEITTDEKISYHGGKLNLTDDYYTVDYITNAQKLLDAKKSDAGTTKLIMSGKLITDSGDTDSTGENTVIGTDVIEKIDSSVELDKVTVKAENNLLIGATTVEKNKNVDGVVVKEQVETGFSVASLTLAQGSDGIVITNNESVTLGGSESTKDGGSLISVLNGKDEVDSTKAVKVVIGTSAPVADGVAEAGTLNIGNSLATSANTYTLKGSAVLNSGSTLNVKGQTEITESVTLNNGTVAVTDGSKLTTATVAVKDSSALTGAVEADTVTIDSGKILSVGSNEKAGELVVNSISGGVVFLDPVWHNGDEIKDASKLAYKGTDGASSVDITTGLAVGYNSAISVGSELSDAYTAFDKTGLTWVEDVTAAAYIGKVATLNSGDSTKGSLIIDGSMTETENTPIAASNAGTVKFADKSLLMVDGTAVTGSNAAISGVTSTEINEGSMLYIDNAKKGETYQILAGANLSKQWAEDKVISSNALLKFTADTNIDNTSNDATKNTYLNYETSVQSVKDVYDAAGYKIVTPDVFDKATAGDGALNDFIMDKAVQETVNSSKAAQASALNSVAEMTELAGAARGTYTAANLFNDAVTEHMTLANNLTHDKDVWAKYIHTKEDIDGLSVAGSDVSYKNKYNGIVVGADVYHNEKATVGVALSYGDGDISGNTLAAHTKNDAKYYGASIYGGIHNGDTAILGDISYLHSKNDITQKNSGESITGTAKANAFSIGVRAEQSLKVGDGQFVPYVGLRYMRLSNDGYTDSLGLHHDGGDLNMWLLPIGVKYSVDAKHGSWTLRPIAEIGYVWNMGDRDAREVVGFNGTSNSFGYDVTDSGSYLGHLGFEVEKGNTTFGIGYQYQKGSSVKENRWNASVNYRF